MVVNVYKGKTKDVSIRHDGTAQFYFKDTVTGDETGASDPGGNFVIGEKAGVAIAALKLSDYFFKLFNEKGIPTHYISADIAARTMDVKAAGKLGDGLEFIARYVAVGSFMRRFGGYCEEGRRFPNGIFEVSLKDDDRGDPFITKEILADLGILTPAQYEECITITKRVGEVMKEDLAKKGIELYDFKIECGIVDGKIILIDEMSAGNMRCYKDGKKLDYLETTELILA